MHNLLTEIIYDQQISRRHGKSKAAFFTPRRGEGRKAGTALFAPGQREGRKTGTARILALFLVFCLLLGTCGQPVQAAITVSTSEKDPTAKNRFTMYVASALNSRRGLCVLLESVDSSGGKKFGLIDTGNANATAARAFLNKHGVKKLEFMILTHMHRDHIGNAAWILKNYPVSRLYLKQFDSNWSNGDQAMYENILRTAMTSPYVQQIYGVSYALSKSKAASPRASKNFLSFLQTHEKSKWRFKGLFNSSNTAIYLGSASLRLFNWEIWAEDGISQWNPVKNTRCKVDKFSPDRSDNCFSLGVRVTRGSHKIWIGGDMNNYRLQRKQHCAWKGDEDRLGKEIGKVNVAVLNHHGNGGSNSRPFLDTLSPSYVVYTSTKADITGAPVASSMLNYIRHKLKVPESHILWSFDYWGTHCKDLAVTLDSKVEKKKPAASTGSSKASSGAAKGLSLSLVPGKTYTQYDVTGDGKKDILSVTGTRTGGVCKGLTISVNKKAVWSTKTSFKDTVPATLIRLPGQQPYICISILSPTSGSWKTKVFGLYRYGRQGSTGSKYVLNPAYNFLTSMPVQGFNSHGTPGIYVGVKQMTIVAPGSDNLSPTAFVSFVLKQGKNGLVPAKDIYPYTTVRGKTGTVTMKAAANLYASADADKKSGTLAKGKKVTVTGVVRNKKKITRYRIVDSNKKVWWICAPAAGK